eukprot:gene40971-54258_t
MSDTQNFTGTRPVAGQHTFDEAALATWLQSRLPGFEGPMTVEMFKGGQSNPTYKLITPQRAYVMRAKPGPVAKLLPSAHAIEREADHRAVEAVFRHHGGDVRMVVLHTDGGHAQGVRQLQREAGAEEIGVQVVRHRAHRRSAARGMLL